MSNEKSKFDSRYDGEEQTFLILTGGSGSAAGKSGKDRLWTASQSIIAYLNCDTEEIIEADGRMEWLADESQKDGWIFNLQAKSIYLIKARKRKSGIKEDYKDLLDHGFMSEIPTFDHHFQLLGVVERDIQHPELAVILAKYETPVIIADQILGEFELNKELDFFEGQIDWLGSEALVYLDQDMPKKDIDSADETLHTLHSLVTDMAKWDNQLRKFAAEKLVELANDWLQESDQEETEAITAETFSDRIKMSELSIHGGGEFEAYYHDDDMFWGHIIIIDGNISGELNDAYIAG